MNISIKHKLFGLMALLISFSLLAYFFLATGLFKKDKIAYVYETSTAVSHGLALQTKSKLEEALVQIYPLVDGYDGTTKKFDVGARQVLKNQDTVEEISIFTNDGKDHFLRSARLAQGAAASGSLRPENLRSGAVTRAEQKVIETAVKNGEGFQVLDVKKHLVLVGTLQHDKKTGDEEIALAQMKLERFFNAFQKNKTYTNFLVDGSGAIVINPDAPQSLTGLPEKKIFGDLEADQGSEGTREASGDDGIPLLISFSRVGVADLYAVAVVDKDKALQAVQVLIKRSVLFFLILTPIGIALSFFASNYLTTTLRELDGATKSVGQGNFNVKVNVRSRDEVGSLARSFNEMSKEVSRLILETADKARMEKELQLARTVQETLFPPKVFQFGELEISAFYEPANECSGDWWHHCEMGDEIFIWMGDATGHGVPAALITSAARAVASVLQHGGKMTPASALDTLNNAIYDTSKGKMLMTFFLLSYNKKTSVLKYSNASHEPPFLLKGPKKEFDKQDIILLGEHKNPRLGETADHAFKESSVALNPGDFVFIYTDGIIDVRNPAGEIWGERKFVKSLLQVVSKYEKSQEIVDQVTAHFSEFRAGSALKDDVTFIALRRV